MALASTQTATVEGVVAHPVTVEANVGPGLPGVHMVGLGDAAVKESRERIRTAVANASLPWPRTKIMVSLSPAHLPKAGSHFDLPVALAVLGSMDPRTQRTIGRTLFLGELALDGTLRRVEAILPMLLQARSRTDIDSIVVPTANADEAALIADPRTFTADSLTHVWSWLLDATPLHPVAPVAPGTSARSGSGAAALDFADIAGQVLERRAMEVAAAGGHHLMMVGPPGSGKSMLAERLPSIMPPLTDAERIECTALHQAAGIAKGALVQERPFIAPHPSLTKAALLGGGAHIPLPGAVSQAHRGVLFLDEASEIPARVLDALRIPLEQREVQLQRGRRTVRYPAAFQLILAANPCPCGGEATRCRCTPGERARHLANISGPLRDRLDLYVRTTAQSAVLSPEDAEPSAVIADRVAAARERAASRWAQAGVGGEEAATNGAVASTLIRRHYPADETGMIFLSNKLGHGELTQRGVDKVLKLAWTLADLEAADTPDIDHVARAAEMHAPAPEEEAA